MGKNNLVMTFKVNPFKESFIKCSWLPVKKEMLRNIDLIYSLLSCLLTLSHRSWLF